MESPQPNLQINVAPAQVGDQIMVVLQIADSAGMSVSLMLNQDSARAVSKAIKLGVEQAEVTIVKPPSMVAQA
jgi:flagellar basal body L-ring protein FlgH